MPGPMKRAMALSLATALLFSVAVPAILADDDDKKGDIIVGPIGIHGFQRNQPDDPGMAIDPTKVDLSALFSALGPDATLYYQHVVTLSNPFFEGRAPGTAGNRFAADYVEFWMKQYGLEPAFPAPENEELGGAVNENWESYRQTFSVRNRRRGGGGNPERVFTDNVGGVLYGKGDLADQWIIIGGHYDHVGYGRGGTVHPGADDNASGTAGVLMAAKHLTERYADAANGDNLRSVLFMAFSAEEMGLLGSRHYVSHPTLSAEQVNVMINMDMIGRLRNNTLLIGGVGSAEGFLDILTPHLEESGMTIYADPNGRGPSDHSSFYGAGIPVVFAFTGTHDIYHQPGDKGYTINPTGAMRIIDLVENIAWDMSTRSEPLNFAEGDQPRQNAPRQRRGRLRVSLGVLPGSDPNLETGVLVNTVFEGSVAEAAGLKKGDVIIGWNDDTIDSAQSLFQHLGQANPGDEVTLKFLRGGETISAKITLKARDG